MILAKRRDGCDVIKQGVIVYSEKEIYFTS